MKKYPFFFLLFLFPFMGIAQSYSIQGNVDLLSPKGYDEFDDILFESVEVSLQQTESGISFYKLKDQTWNIGQLFQFRVNPARAGMETEANGGYYYLFSLNSTGGLKNLFPTTGSSSQRIAETRILPSPHNAYSILGKDVEEYGLLFSYYPLQGLPQIHKDLVNASGNLSERFASVFGSKLANNRQVIFQTDHIAFELSTLDKVVPLVIRIPTQRQISFEQKPDLHILAIGPGFVDLQFTEKDAEDVVKVLKKQQGKAFHRILPTVLKGSAADRNAVIAELDLLKGKGVKGKISKDDLLIVFFSSAGFLKENELRIQLAKYNVMDMDNTSIRYSELIDRLKHIHCDKLLLFDVAACDGNMAEEIVDYEPISPVKPLFTHRLTTILSNSQGEISYEDAAWQNGAFTHALVEGFEGKADKNEDGQIYLSEIYEYLVYRTNELVSETRGVTQTPVMPDPSFTDRIIIQR